MAYVVAYDIGTTGVKTCLFSIGERISLVDSLSAGYSLTILPDGGAEQNADEWWSALCTTTRALLERNAGAKDKIEAISSCSQMQALVLVDSEGQPVHNPMSYMDQRGSAQMDAHFKGGIEVAGANVFKLLKCLSTNLAAPTSVKDPVWKYLWIRDNEPEAFSRAAAWLDVKDYLNARMTGRFTMSQDSAFATLLYDTKKKCWSQKLCRMFSVNPAHLPEIVKSSDIVGTLTPQSAEELGLSTNVKVFSGGGDASLIPVGAGAGRVGSSHIYWGTSGWVGTTLDRQRLDIAHLVASTVGVQEGRYNYFAEMETAGKCLEWVRDHLALDEIGIYLEKKNVTESLEGIYRSLYDYLSQTIGEVPAGSGGVLFTPWLHGNRCPFEDPAASSMFFNIKLETGKAELIRSVVEGVCHHLKWMLDIQAEKVKVGDTLRFVGGGALSDQTCRILASITGKTIEVTQEPQNAGALGAAALAAVGLGIRANLDSATEMIEVERTYQPDEAEMKVYERDHEVFKKLYGANRKLMRSLNVGGVK